MFRADRLLNDALDELKRAGSDYGGHRPKAVELVRAAIAEVNEGIAFGGMQQRSNRHSDD